jgi:O-antigen ligase
MREAEASIAITGPSDRWLRGWGNLVIFGAFSFAVLILFFLTWKVDWALPYYPILLLGGIGMWWLFQRPLLNLAVVLVSFVLIADFEEGIQITEVFYGLYYIGFLFYWFFKRLFLDERAVFERPEEKAIWIFLILVTLSFPLTLLFGGPFKMWLGEWLSLSMLGFYFPVKEAIEKHDNALKVLIWVISLIGLFVLGRNMLNYMSALNDAEQAWEIAKGRAVTNEGLLMVPAFFMLSLYLFAKDWTKRLLYAGFFIAFFGGLILTQSRGYWVAFLFGAGIMFLMIPSKQKGRLLSTGIVTGLVVFGIAALLFGDFFLLVVTGLVERFTSIGSATTKDLSLVNRFIETGAVWEHIKSNPILGHGMGVSYRFYDITWEFTDSKPFIHNGYIALWYKFGIWGTPLILWFLGAIMYRAKVLFNHRVNNPYMGTAAIAILAAFMAFSVSANTSNPFYINDTMFIFSVMAGIVGGGYSLQKRNAKLNEYAS